LASDFTLSESFLKESVRQRPKGLCLVPDSQNELDSQHLFDIPSTVETLHDPSPLVDMSAVFCKDSNSETKLGNSEREESLPVIQPALPQESDQADSPNDTASTTVSDQDPHCVNAYSGQTISKCDIDKGTDFKTNDSTPTKSKDDHVVNLTTSMEEETAEETEKGPNTLDFLFMDEQRILESMKRSAASSNYNTTLECITENTQHQPTPQPTSPFTRCMTLDGYAFCLNTSEKVKLIVFGATENLFAILFQTVCVLYSIREEQNIHEFEKIQEIPIPSSMVCYQHYNLAEYLTLCAGFHQICSEG
jgi:hypothetical protein